MFLAVLSWERQRPVWGFSSGFCLTTAVQKTPFPPPPPLANPRTRPSFLQLVGSREEMQTCIPTSLAVWAATSRSVGLGTPVTLCWCFCHPGLPWRPGWGEHGVLVQAGNCPHGKRGRVPPFTLSKAISQKSASIFWGVHMRDNRGVPQVGLGDAPGQTGADKRGVHVSVPGWWSRAPSHHHPNAHLISP